MFPNGAKILHQFQGFVLAELPAVEAGVKNLLSISADNRAILHRVLQSGEVISSEMNLPVLRAIVDVANQIVGQ